MKAPRASFAFAAALFAVSLAPAKEFYNGRLDGGVFQNYPTANPEVRWGAMGKHASSAKGFLTAHVTINAKGRATKVVLTGTSGTESRDYTITRSLRKARYERPAQGGEHVAVILVPY